METLAAPLQIGAHNVGLSAQLPAKKGPGNLTSKQRYIMEVRGVSALLGRTYYQHEPSCSGSFQL